jgi:hypothetical protein
VVEEGKQRRDGGRERKSEGGKRGGWTGKERGEGEGGRSVQREQEIRGGGRLDR